MNPLIREWIQDRLNQERNKIQFLEELLFVAESLYQEWADPHETEADCGSDIIKASKGKENEENQDQDCVLNQDQ